MMDKEEPVLFKVFRCHFSGDKPCVCELKESLKPQQIWEDTNPASQA